MCTHIGVGWVYTSASTSLSAPAAASFSCWRRKAPDTLLAMASLATSSASSSRGRSSAKRSLAPGWRTGSSDEKR